MTVIIVALIIAATVLGYSYLNQNSRDNKPENNKTIDLSADELGLSGATPTPIVKNKPEGKIGEPALLDGFAVIIDDAAWGNYDNKRMYRVSAKEANVGTVDLRCSPPSIEWKLVDKSGIAHVPIYGLKQGNILDKWTLKSNQIPPGQEVKGDVYFDIPEAIVPDYLIIQPCSLTTQTDKTIKIFLSR